jgi:RimJ/RimL family protein N-acetyltransferase
MTTVSDHPVRLSPLDDSARVGATLGPSNSRCVQIQTERLLLRQLALADLDEFVAVHADAAVTRFVPSFAPDQAVARIRLDQREWAERGHGLMAIVERDTSRFIGRAGLKYWPQFDETEVGWVLRRDAWGMASRPRPDARV